jgi:hypothetical protein
MGKMTQQDTWIMHFMAGICVVSLPAIAAYIMAGPQLEVALAASLANAAYWLGRERRDHEIKTGLKDIDWNTGWNILKWSRDGQMDLVTGILGGAIPVGIIMLIPY